MILQSLVNYYEALKGKGLIAVPGWAEAKISYALQLSPDGTLIKCVCMMEETQRGKRMVQTPKLMNMPASVKRTGPSFRPNFLFDNSAYTIGIDAKGDPERAETCFREAGKYYRQLLRHVKCPEAAALLRYYDTWDPGMAGRHPALQAHIKDFLKGGNLTFKVGDIFLHDIPELRKAWDDEYSSKEDAVIGTDLVTNCIGPVAGIHPSIRGVAGAQATGAALVSFNEPSSCSYGKAQGYNAPVSKQNAFAYTAALNYLAADMGHQIRIGTVTVFHWAENASTGYQDFVNAYLFGRECCYSREELQDMAERIISGEAVEAFDTVLTCDMRYTFLAISPNASRLSIRLFQQDAIGNFLCNILVWNLNMRLLDGYGQDRPISVYQVLMAAGNENSKDACLNPLTTAEVLRAMLMGAPVPAILYSNVQRRITAERNITRGQAAVIKAYCLTAPMPNVSKEALSVSLNPDCTEIPYILGRLFATLEEIQHKANPKQVSIRTRYFRAASANPTVVFPLLLRNSEYHMRALGNARWYLRWRLEGLLVHLEQGYPKTLSLSEQGAFQLGYYHQRSARYAHTRVAIEESDTDV